MHDGGVTTTLARSSFGALHQRILAREARIGIIGLGYVGLPLAIALARKGLSVTGFDIDVAKVEALNRSLSYFHHIPASQIDEVVASGRFRAVDDFSQLGSMDAILICVPTPLTHHREPDLRFVIDTAEVIAVHLRPGKLIILESTTYPGTTREVVRPILERDGLKSGVDFLLAFSPEREDPGNAEYDPTCIPKVIGGDGPEALRLARALYDQFVIRTIPVSNAETAEAVKLTENIFRAVNIALVNELKLIYGAMGIDIWEVIDAAKTKPFGFMPFYPGPGLGGHCIPIDPFYLTWKAREHEVSTRFIELAGEINMAMPRHVIECLAQALNERFGKSMRGTRILLIGLAYKRNVDDTRESPSFKLMELAERMGARVSYHDPFVAEIGTTREYAKFAGRYSIALDPKTIRDFDAAVIATDHDVIDYRLLATHCPLVVDTRNACARTGIRGDNIVKA